MCRHVLDVPASGANSQISVNCRDHVRHPGFPVSLARHGAAYAALARQRTLQASFEAMRAFTDARTADTPDEIWLVEHPPSSR